MKFFETPVVEVVKFAVEDVVTTSGSTGGMGGDGNYGGMGSDD